MDVAYLGLGIMGSGMAANLLKAGHRVTVWNRTPARARILGEAGAQVAASPAEAARAAEVVGLCVTDGRAVAEVLEGPQGLLAALRPGQLVVDHSTISPEDTRAFARRVAERGAEWCDAPVTGGDRGAREGTLTIMVGGSEEAFRRLGPYLHAIGRTVVHVGPVGQGQVVKLVNNFMGAVAMAGAAEGLWLGLQAGVPLDKLLAVCSAGSANSASLQILADRLARGDFQPGFSLRNRQKDLDLALDLARRLALALPVGAVVAECFRERLRAGEGELDQTVLARRYPGLAPGS
jgi:3-hydroxyisobutyrate dehydrogenase